MRFLFKTVFWLGLIAFFLPSGSPDEPSSQGIDLFTAFLGAQEVVGDLGGFCERAPTACAAGSQIAGFVGERVSDGTAMAIAALRGGFDPLPEPTRAAPQPVTARASTEILPAGPLPYRPPVADPMATAAIAAGAVRRSVGLPVAEGDATAAPAAQPAATPADLKAPAVPTPAPRA